MEFNMDIARFKESKGLFVGIPMYGGACSGVTTSSLMSLIHLATSHGIKIQPYFLYQESLVQRARNM